MFDEHDLKVLEAMERYGGGFVSALAAAWRQADIQNAARLRAAFDHYWRQYEQTYVQRKEAEHGQTNQATRR